jgi:hypothetical protein
MWGTSLMWSQWVWLTSTSSGLPACRVTNSSSHCSGVVASKLPFGPNRPVGKRVMYGSNRTVLPPMPIRQPEVPSHRRVAEPAGAVAAFRCPFDADAAAAPAGSSGAAAPSAAPRSSVRRTKVLRPPC